MAQLGSTIGELVVIALKAANGKQDPFCIFKLGSVAKKTKTDRNGGQNPIWDDQINLPVPPGATRLFIQIFSRQASQENLISEGHVDLNEVLRKGEHDGFFPLVLNGKKAGQIYLELTFYAVRSWKARKDDCIPINKIKYL
ncbi:C2 domain-containing protein [Absidia repens]|uniref:C2 domain-containing protein n=1 Tax=Absidia repens TaxID=90262 RepID=A0A1X2I0I4_9FUNG|nr:C2 domain-containing protein [Absidia repens]